MPIGLRDLKNVKKQTLEEHRLREAFIKDVLRVVGPRIQTDRRSIRQICDDVLMVTEGISLNQQFKSSVLSRLARHSAPEARRLAARFADGFLLEKLTLDNDVNVLSEVVRRVPLERAKTIARRHIREDGLQFIVEERSVAEVVPQSTELVSEMDPEDRRDIEKRSHEDDVMDDFWYEEVARNIVETYGNTMETVWIRTAVNQYAAAVKSMLGIPIDVPKLLEAVNDILNARDEQYIDYHNVLKVTVENLQRTAARNDFELAVTPHDELDELLEGRASTVEIIETCERIFNVKMSDVSRRLKGMLIAEDRCVPSTGVPRQGSLPTETLRCIDEQALNLYVEAWSRINSPFSLSWCPDGEEIRFLVSALGVKE